MRLAAWIALLSVLVSTASIAAVHKDNDRPDKEMLQMMDLLKNMEMIKQIDLMQDMQKVESVGEPAASTNPQKSTVVKKREAAK